MGIALSGLQAATQKIGTIASNIANLQTVGSLVEGKQAPYTPLSTARNTITTSDGNPLGVQSQVIPRNNPFVPAFDPDSPFADENGIIGIPNINLAAEIVGLNLEENIFKANIIALKASEELADELFRIFDEEV